MWWLLVITFLLSSLQLTLVPFVFVSGTMIDLVLVFVMSWAMLKKGSSALWLAFLAGLVLNQYSALHMGFLPLFYVVIAYLATLVSSDMIDNNWLLAVVLGFTLSGLFELLVLLSFWFGGHNLFTLDYLSQIVLVRVLLNTTFMLLLFPVLRALNSNLNQRHKALLP